MSRRDLLIRRLADSLTYELSISSVYVMCLFCVMSSTYSLTAFYSLKATGGSGCPESCWAGLGYLLQFGGVFRIGSAGFWGREPPVALITTALITTLTIATHCYDTQSLHILGLIMIK